MENKTSSQEGSSSISSCSASTSSSSFDKKTASTSSSSMDQKTSTGSFACSSTSVSRNPAAAIQPYDEILQRFQTLWCEKDSSTKTDFVCNANGVPILGTTPKIETSYYRDLGEQQLNGVQKQRFPYLGSSSSSNPSVADDYQRYIDFKKNTQAQLMASLALINGDRPTAQAQLMASLTNEGGVLNSYSDPARNYLGLDRVHVNSINRFNRHAINNGYTSDDQTTPLGYLSPRSSSINDEDFDARNLRDKLIESKGWPVEKVLKIWSNDPSLLDEINQHDIVMVAELKLGSLYLQRILKDQNPLYFNKIFDATLDCMFHLMTNSEGTYVIRKLHSFCGFSHMTKIVGKIRLQHDDVKYAARNEYGADTLMKLIRILNSSYPLLLKSVLDSLIFECVTIMGSKPGSSLFRSCLKYLNSRQNQILHNKVATNCIDLAIDDSGYVSLIALIENTQNPYKEELLFKISDKAVLLAQDPKGNYVIQAILSLHIPELDLVICRNLLGTYLCLSMHKCASNVVEKCIMSSGMEYPILELIFRHKLHLLAQDPIGNYVVQRALNATQQLKRLDLYDSLVAEVQPFLKDLQYHPIGRNVFRLINKRKVIMSRSNGMYLDR